MPPRRFSLDEANGLIPRLSQLLLQIQDKKRELDALQERLVEFAHKMSGDGHILEKEVNVVRQEAEKAANELNAIIKKLSELGCELKDIDQGLVDFRTLRAGREVYLCWKLGEDAVHWWHELEAGFSGRQPLEGSE